MTSDTVDMIYRILMDHADKDFVQRILVPRDAPYLLDEEGRHMTHFMSWGTVGGEVIVFPRLMRNDEGELTDYGDSAFSEALNRGEYIKMGTPEDAEWFTKNYKQVWE